MPEYQPKTGARCLCKRGVQRDNCPTCEGTGRVIDFAAIRARTVPPPITTRDNQERESIEYDLGWKPKVEHTPTPWRVLGSAIIGYPESQIAVARTLSNVGQPAEANAAFICKAVNAHDALVAAVRLFGHLRDSGRADMDADEVSILDNALKLAEGEGANA